MPICQGLYKKMLIKISQNAQNAIMRLKELRKSKGLLQSEIADVLGISNSTYAYYEREERKLTPTMLCRLADFFDVTVDELLGRTQPSLFDDARIEQQRVLQMYQQLTPHQQDLIMERMQGFIDGNVERQQLERAQQANRPAVQYFIPTRQQIDE